MGNVYDLYLRAIKNSSKKELSDKLMATSVITYNQKRDEAIQQGTAYGLDANRALGAPAKLPIKNIKVNY